MSILETAEPDPAVFGLRGADRILQGAGARGAEGLVLAFGEFPGGAARRGCFRSFLSGDGALGSGAERAPSSFCSDGPVDRLAVGIPGVPGGYIYPWGLGAFLHSARSLAGVSGSTRLERLLARCPSSALSLQPIYPPILAARHFRFGRDPSTVVLPAQWLATSSRTVVDRRMTVRADHRPTIASVPVRE